jgi:hypothetical protein
VYYQWKIGNESVPSSGHLFTPSEMAELFRRSQLRIVERLAVNYANGTISNKPFEGQLFFRLTHA